MTSPKQPTLLIVDDSPEDRELYRHYLRSHPNHSYTILEASLGQQGLELWQQQQPDLVLLDYRLPDLDGLEFLAQLPSTTPQLCLPVIVMTGEGNEAIAVQAMKAGAQDYLIKGQITPEGLHLAIHGAIETVRLRTELQQRIERERVVGQITRQVYQSLDLDRILQTTVTEVRQFLKTDRVLVFQLQPDGNGTVVAESVGAAWQSLLASTIYDPCLAENYLRFSRPESLNLDPASAEAYVKRYRQGQVTAIPNIHSSDIDPCHIELLAQFQVKANLVVPILNDDRFWGLLIAHHCAAPRLWQSLEIDLLKELATQLGIALRQAELYQQSQAELAERNRVEAELRESEERLRSALEASRMGTWDWNIVTGQIQWSSNLKAMFGLESGAFDGSFQMFSERLHLDDRDRVLAAIDQAIATGEDYEIEFRVVYPNGTVRWALSQGKVFYNRDGQPVRMAGNDIDITDRKRTEAALRQNEQLLRLALTGAQAGSWDWEILTSKVVWSSENYDLHGLSPTLSIQYEDWANTLHPDDRDRINAETWRCIEEKQAEYRVEFRIIHPQRGIRWLQALGRLIVNDQGEPIRLSGINLDITDRKLAEDGLQQSEAFNRRILESSSDCIKLLNLNGQLLYMNPGGLCMMEIEDIGPYINADWASLWEEDMRETVEAAIATAQTGELIRFQGFCPTAKGTPKWWDVVLTPILNSEGQASQLLATSRDITERIQAEAALRQSEERFRTLADNMSQFAWMAHANGDIFWYNQRWFHYTGTTLEEMQGWGWQKVHHPDHVDRVVQHIRHCFETGQLWEDTFPLRGQDGQYRWFLSRAIPIRSEQGEIVCWFGTNTDITERKQSELERDRLLEQEQAARASAERANRIKDEFLAVLSHELRSPLNPILGWTKLMQSRKFDTTKTSEALATIERNAKLQTQLIDDLLDVAKILRGKLSMNVTPVDLVFVLEQAIDTMRTAAVAKAITLQAELPQIGRVSGDAARLQQIVWNLLSNAIKFTPAQGCVEIRLERGGDQAKIIVSDTGKGINPDFLPHIFESFRQEDASTTRQYGGLGLGLAIVRHLVEAHGGTICADSLGENQGTTFTVQLPLLDAESAPPPSAAVFLDELDLTGIRILAVDDEPDARELLTVLLTQYGAEVLTVTSATDVLTHLESFRPDVLISDIGMPEMDGYMLIQQIRALSPEKGGQTLAIALTAYARGEDYQRAIASGYQRHLTKPLDLDQLVKAVVELKHGVAELKHEFG